MAAEPPPPTQDSDGDGLDDAAEVVAGTAVDDPDTDHDGLLDGWEVLGVSTAAGHEPLASYGADPLRKDIFVELDWMLDGTGAAQTNAVIAYQAAVDVVRVFRRSSGGIRIHFDLGPRIKSYVPGELLEPDIAFDDFLDEPDEEKLLPFQDSFPARPGGGSQAPSTALSLHEVYFGGRYFRPSRRNVFYYVVLAEQRKPPEDGGVFDGDRNHPYTESFSDDLARRDGLIPSGVQICVLFRKPSPDLSPAELRYQYSSTLLHELGHAFGLGHGGAISNHQWDNTNWKPNYLSTMNYRFQLCGLDLVEGMPLMDFSHGTLKVPLVEKALLEPVGMGRLPSEHVLECVGVSRLPIPAFRDNVDWNRDGVITDNFVQRDLNENGKLDETPLTDHDDWGKFAREGFDGIGRNAFRGCGWACGLGAALTVRHGSFDQDRSLDLFFVGTGGRAAFGLLDASRRLVLLPPPPEGPARFASGDPLIVGDFLGWGRDLIFSHWGREAGLFEARAGQVAAVWSGDSVLPADTPGDPGTWTLSSSDRFVPLKLYDSDRVDLAVTNGRGLALLSTSSAETPAGAQSPKLSVRWHSGKSFLEWTQGEVPVIRPGRTFSSGRQSLFVLSANTWTELLAGPTGVVPVPITVEGRIPAAERLGAVRGWRFSANDVMLAVDLNGDGSDEVVLKSSQYLCVVMWDGDGNAHVEWLAKGEVGDGAWPLAHDLATEQLYTGRFLPGPGHQVLASNGQTLFLLGWNEAEMALELVSINNRYLTGLRPAWELRRGQVLIPGRFLPEETDALLIQSPTELLVARFEGDSFHAVYRISGQIGAWFFNENDILTPAQTDEDPELELFARNGDRHGVLELLPPRTSHFLARIDPQTLVLAEIPRFRRGDVNQDGEVDISDIVRVLGYLFLGFQEPPCLDAADMDDSGAVEMSDPIFLLQFLFNAGRDLPPPGSVVPGIDPTTDGLGCGPG